MKDEKNQNGKEKNSLPILLIIVLFKISLKSYFGLKLI